MWYLILSILCSTVIVLLFKVFEEYRIRTFPAICINYLTAVACAWAALGHFPIRAGSFFQPWTPAALLLGLIFITGFNIVAFTVRYFNVTVAAVMQKMSLVLTVLYTIIVYGEVVNALKVLGVLLAIGAIILINIPPKAAGLRPVLPSRWYFLLPGLTLLLSAVIEVIFFRLEKQTGNSADLGFVAFLFGTAALIGNVRLVFEAVRGRWLLGWKEVGGGILLGVPNFGSIYFLLKTLNTGWEGSVIFPVNNVGIIALSALAAFLFFREKLSSLNLIGLLCSVLAIIFIAFSAV